MSVLERRQLVPRPRAEVFAFFAEPRNLEIITPSFLRFRIATEGALAMKKGAVIDYRLSLFGVPFGWRTIIDAYEPNECFVDRQERGPYRTWIHTHSFEDEGEGTAITDRVVYELPLGPLGSIARKLFVERTLERIFDHRAAVIAQRFGR